MYVLNNLRAVGSSMGNQTLCCPSIADTVMLIEEFSNVNLYAPNRMQWDYQQQPKGGILRLEMLCDH